MAVAYIGNGPLQRVKRSLSGGLGLVLFFGLSWKPVSWLWLQLFPFFLFPPKVKEIPSKKIRKCRKEGETGVVPSLEDSNWFDFRNLENLIFLASFPSLTPDTFRKTILLLS